MISNDNDVQYDCQFIMDTFEHYYLSLGEMCIIHVN